MTPEQQERHHIISIQSRIDYLAEKVANSSKGARNFHVAELKALRWALEKIDRGNQLPHRQVPDNLCRFSMRNERWKLKDITTMTNYLLRGIPSELWQAAKHAAIDRKISLRGLIFRALREYIKNGDLQSDAIEALRLLYLDTEGKTWLDTEEHQDDWDAAAEEADKIAYKILGVRNPHDNQPKIIKYRSLK